MTAEPQMILYISSSKETCYIKSSYWKLPNYWGN